MVRKRLVSVSVSIVFTLLVSVSVFKLDSIGEMSSAGLSLDLFWLRSLYAPFLLLHRLSLSLPAERYDSPLNMKVFPLSQRSSLNSGAILSFVVKMDKLISSSIESNSWPAPSGTIIGLKSRALW